MDGVAGANLPMGDGRRADGRHHLAAITCARLGMVDVAEST
jgi:hypothetical protein